MRYLLPLLFGLLTSASAIAAKDVRLSPACPGVNPNTDWVSFISGEVTHPGFNNIFDVRFDRAEIVNDPTALNHLRTDACYRVLYDKDLHGGYLSSRAFGPGGPKQSGPDSKVGLPGDPADYEINVYGELLHYDPSGQVYDHRGRVVGFMACTLSRGCAPYGVTDHKCDNVVIPRGDYSKAKPKDWVICPEVSMARLQWQGDGNLVLIGENGHVRWSSQTHGAGDLLQIQGDGNVVIYDSLKKPIWKTDTKDCSKASLTLQSDNNLVLYEGDRPVWSTGTSKFNFCNSNARGCSAVNLTPHKCE